MSETKVDETKPNETKPSETKPKKMVSRNVAVALGIICIVLVAVLAGTVVLMNSQITYLQDQLNELLNVTVIPLGTITSNPSAWVSRTVIVEGNLYSFPFPVIVRSPYNYELSSDGQMIGVSLSASVNMSTSLWNQVLFNSAYVRIHGVIEKGEITYTGQGSTDTYYIEALTVEPL
ncbi:MAG: hypothetical protein ABSG57_12935 [Candidatus Bathyarchaeia archaeon]